MIVCPTCRHNNPETARACENCGRSLEGFIYRTCPACGALNPAQSAFCRRCLSELVGVGGEQAAKEPEGEILAPEAPRAEGVQPISADAQEAEPSQQPKESGPTLVTETGSPTGQEATLLPVTAEEAAGPQEGEGGLAGIIEPLPLAEAVVGPHEIKTAEPQQPTEAEQFGAALFREVAEAKAPLHEPIRLFPLRRTMRLPLGGRVILYLLVLAAAAVPFFSRGQSSLWIQPRPSVIAFARTIYELPEGSTVMVSFDYTPTYAGEMDVLALTLLRHLTQRSVRVVAMSTKPAGLGLAQQVLSTIQAENPDYGYGQDYVLLGYLPGEEIGLRTLNASLPVAFKTDYVEQRALSDLPIMQGLNTLGDLDAVIILSDDSQTVRQWIEQVQSRGNVFMYAVVTAAVQPLLVPYQQSGQLDHLVGGIQEAAEYEVVSGVTPTALGLLDGYVALFGLMAAVAIIANIVFLARREWRKDGSD
jgi:hypothetical protein